MNWQPGIEDCALLLETALPDLAIASIDVLGEGWDSVAFLANGTIVFRLPKREPVERMFRRERQLLAVIADRMPVAVPPYEFVADDLPGFPSSVGGYRFLSGTPLSSQSLADLLLERLAEQLSDVLIALHKTQLSSIPGLDQGDPVDWWQERWRRYESSVSAIGQELPSTAAKVVRSRWEDAFASARRIAFAPALVHGDLAMEHILLDGRKELTGIIDFGDSGPGDPAIDLAGFPGPLANRILAWYAPDADERDRLIQRRRFYRLTVPFHAINAGIELEQPELLEQGIAGLRQRFGV